MNTKEELTKLLMESYDRGVEDAKQAAITSIKQAIILEREACAKVCEDVHAGKYDAPEFWREGVAYTCAAAIRARSKP